MNIDWNIVIGASIPVILGGVGAYLGWLYKKEHEKRVNLESQVQEERKKLYFEYIDIFKGISLKKPLPTDIEEKMKSIAINLMFLASDEVIKAFNFAKVDIEKMSEKKRLEALGRLFIAMRKDIGYPKTGLDFIDLHQLIIKDNLRDYLSKVE